MGALLNSPGAAVEAALLELNAFVLNIHLHQTKTMFEESIWNGEQAMYYNNLCTQQYQSCFSKKAVAWPSGWMVVCFEMAGALQPPLNPEQVLHLNLATNTGHIPLSDAMTEVFNARFNTKLSRLILDVLWHHTEGGPDPGALYSAPLTASQVATLNTATSNGQRQVDEEMLGHFNGLFHTNYERPDHLEDLYRLSAGGPGLNQLYPSLQQPLISALPY
ncbi:MAG: hypothetical protein MMC23_008539 [Stictis urceolatum]|nr:hypothetical protein [Stictis urceolata]